MEARSLWKRSRLARFLFSVCLVALLLPGLAMARRAPGDERTGELWRQGAVQLDTIIAACKKHHLACHRLPSLLGAHEEERRDQISPGSARSLVAVLTTTDYEFEKPDTNPTISVPFFAAGPAALPGVFANVSP